MIRISIHSVTTVLHLQILEYHYIVSLLPTLIVVCGYQSYMLWFIFQFQCLNSSKPVFSFFISPFKKSSSKQLFKVIFDYWSNCRSRISLPSISVFMSRLSLHKVSIFVCHVWSSSWTAGTTKRPERSNCRNDQTVGTAVLQITQKFTEKKYFKKYF